PRIGPGTTRSRGPEPRVRSRRPRLRHTPSSRAWPAPPDIAVLVRNVAGPSSFPLPSLGLHVRAFRFRQETIGRGFERHGQRHVVPRRGRLAIPLTRQTDLVDADDAVELRDAAEELADLRPRARGPHLHGQTRVVLVLGLRARGPAL